MPCTNVKAKKAFSAILGAWAKGNFAIKASSKVARAEAKAVAVKTAPLVHPCRCQDRGIDSQNVTHCQERRNPGNDLRAQCHCLWVDPSNFFSISNLINRMTT